MTPLTLSNETRLLQPQAPDQVSLSICDINENGLQYMVSLWQPSVEEIEQIIAGQPIKLAVLGRRHPPVIVAVEPKEQSGE